MKPWYKSKTVWFSILTAALAGLNYYSGEVKDPTQLNFFLGCIAVGNVIMRFATKEGIGKEA